MREIALEIAELVEKKNSDYGNSFEETLKKYGDAAYFMRIEDKLSRLKSLVNKDGQVNESQEDTLRDIIGYTLLMIDCKRNKNEKDLRIRGFEKISENQFKKDFKGLEVDYEDIKLPKRSTKLSAGYDIFSPVKIELEPGQDIKLPTGLRAYMRETEYLEAVPRSGQGFKYYLRLANTVGIIDADYRFSDNEGHFYVKLRNEGNKKVVIEKGIAMFQVIFKTYLLADGDSTQNGEIRNGGFGSSSKGGI
ncbi:nucleotide modification associated domain-containing protein [Fusobacterium varium]